MVTMPPCHGEWCRFESGYARKLFEIYGPLGLPCGGTTLSAYVRRRVRLPYGPHLGEYANKRFCSSEYSPVTVVIGKSYFEGIAIFLLRKRMLVQIQPRPPSYGEIAQLVEQVLRNFLLQLFFFNDSHCEGYFEVP